MQTNKDTFKESMARIDRAINNIEKLNKFIKRLEKPPDKFN